MLLKQFGNIMVDQVTIPIIICGLVHKSGMYNISYIYSLSIRLIVTYSSLEGILNQSSHSASKKLNSQSHHTIFIFFLIVAWYVQCQTLVSLWSLFLIL